MLCHPQRRQLSLLEACPCSKTRAAHYWGGSMKPMARWTLLSLLPVLTVLRGAGFGELAWEAGGGQTLFHLSKHLQLLVRQNLLSLELEVRLCSCHRVLALPSPVGCCMGMARWGHLLLVARATASRNLLNKPIKWQTGLEPPAAWGSL